MNKRSSLRVSKTDWKRVRAMKDKDIMLTPEHPALDARHVVRGIVRRGLKPVADIHTLFGRNLVPRDVEPLLHPGIFETYPQQCARAVHTMPMMDKASEAVLIGTGVYTVPQAARLVDVPAASIRRWLFGYKYKQIHGGSVTRAANVTPALAQAVQEHRILTFKDLIEIHFVNAFLTHGVSWPTIKVAAARARDITQDDHPFATNRFFTDGETIFTEIRASSKNTELLDLKQGQMAFRRILKQSLMAKLDLGAAGVERWWPLGKRRPVMVDPDRQFGQPITKEEGVPTAVLAKSVAAMGTIDRVARWYDVDPKAVRASVELEKRLAA